MKFISSYKKFESQNITCDQFSSFDNPDTFNKRELDLIEEYSERNTWDYQLTDTLIEIFIHKSGVATDVDCDVTIEKQQDEYYLVEINTTNLQNMDKSETDFYLLDGYDEYKEFLDKLQYYSKHKTRLKLPKF